MRARCRRSVLPLAVALAVLAVLALPLRALPSDEIDSDLQLARERVYPALVNIAVVGTYTVTYNVSDNSGNAAAPVTRTVRVGVRAGTGGGGGGSFDLIGLLALAGFVVLAAFRPLVNRRIGQ